MDLQLSDSDSESITSCPTMSKDTVQLEESSECKSTEIPNVADNSSSDLMSNDGVSQQKDVISDTTESSVVQPESGFVTAQTDTIGVPNVAENSSSDLMSNDGSTQQKDVISDTTEQSVAQPESGFVTAQNGTTGGKIPLEFGGDIQNTETPEGQATVAKQQANSQEAAVNDHGSTQQNEEIVESTESSVVLPESEYLTALNNTAGEQVPEKSGGNACIEILEGHGAREELVESTSLVEEDSTTEVILPKKRKSDGELLMENYKRRKYNEDQAKVCLETNVTLKDNEDPEDIERRGHPQQIIILRNTIRKIRLQADLRDREIRVLRGQEHDFEFGRAKAENAVLELYVRKLREMEREVLTSKKALVAHTSSDTFPVGDIEKLPLDVLESVTSLYGHVHARLAK